MRPRAGRWRDRAGQPRRAGGRERHRRERVAGPLQGVRRRSGRDGLRRRRGTRGPGAVVRRPAQRPRGAGRAAGQRDQPGRREQRAHLAEHGRSTARDPGGARGRHPDTRGRRRGGGARHRYRPGRPDRGDRPAHDPRAGQAGRPAPVPRVDQVEHRAQPGRGGDRGADQDGVRDPARAAAAHAARRAADLPRRLVHGVGRGAHAGASVAGDGPSASCGGVLVRAERHERARDRRTASRRGTHRTARPADPRGRAVAAVGQVPGRAPRPGRSPARLRRERDGAGPGRRRVLAAHHAEPAAAPGRAQRGDGEGLLRATRRARRRGAGARHGAGQRAAQRRQAGVRLLGAGIAVAGHGGRVAHRVPGLRRECPPVRGGLRVLRGLLGHRRAQRGRGRGLHGAARRRATGAVHDDGVAGRSLALLRHRTRGGRGSFAGRDRGRTRGRGADAGRRGADRRPAVACVDAHRRAGRHGLGVVAARRTDRAGRAVGRALGGRRQRPRAGHRGR